MDSSPEPLCSSQGSGSHRHLTHALVPLSPAAASWLSKVSATKSLLYTNMPMLLLSSLGLVECFWPAQNSRCGEKLGSTIISCHRLFIATDWCSAESFWDFRVNQKAVSTENCLSPKWLFPHPSHTTHSQTIFWLACRLSKVTFPSSELTANLSCRWTKAGHFVESWTSWSLLQQNWLSYLTTCNHTLKTCIFLFVCTLMCTCQFMCVTRVQKPAEARRGCQRPGAGVTRL